MKGGKLATSLLLAVSVAVIQIGDCQSDRNNLAEKFQEEAGQIYTTVFHKYNERVRPPDFYPNPVPVEVHASLIHIRGLDVIKQELESIMDLEIKWQDTRLAWYANKVVMITVELSRVWRPSLVYLNGAIPPSPLFDPKVTISAEGMITWNRREIVTTVCRTAPRNASQICDISLGFTSPERAELFDNLTTFTITPDFTNHRWDISEAQIDTGDEDAVHFVLELVELDPSQAGFGGRNCSGDVSYDISNAGHPFAAVRHWGVVLMACLLWGVLVKA